MTIFSDGFESGDFSAWTGISGSPSPTVTNTSPLQGAYSATATKTNGVGGTSYKTISAIGTLYAGTYVKWDANPSSGKVHSFMQIQTGGFQIGVYNVSGTIKWACYIGAWQTSNISNPTNNTKYWVEIYFDKNTSNGWMKVDGVTVLSGLSCANVDITTFRVGAVYVTTDTITFTWDRCIVSDVYIGPESSYSPKTRSSLPNTMTTLLNSKILFS